MKIIAKNVNKICKIITITTVTVKEPIKAAKVELGTSFIADCTVV